MGNNLRLNEFMSLRIGRKSNLPNSGNKLLKRNVMLVLHNRFGLFSPSNTNKRRQLNKGFVWKIRSESSKNFHRKLRSKKDRSHRGTYLPATFNPLYIGSCILGPCRRIGLALYRLKFDVDSPAGGLGNILGAPDTTSRSF